MVHFRFTPSNNAPNYFWNSSDYNYVLVLKHIIHIIVKGRTVELRNTQNPESETPIISPLLVFCAVIKFRYPFNKNSIIPSIANPYKLL